MSRFDYVRYDESHVKMQEEAKQACVQLEHIIGKLGGGRPQSLALTKLEECYMWVGKAVRDHQIENGGDATHQPARGE